MPSSARMVATASGWVMNGSPDLRSWPRCVLLRDVVRPLQDLQVRLRVGRAVGGDQRLQHGLDPGRSLAPGGEPAGQPGPDPAPVRRRVDLVGEDLVRGDLLGLLVVEQEREAGQRLGRVGVGLELGLLAHRPVVVAAAAERTTGVRRRAVGRRGRTVGGLRQAIGSRRGASGCGHGPAGRRAAGAGSVATGPTPLAAGSTPAAGGASPAGGASMPGAEPLAAGVEPLTPVAVPSIVSGVATACSGRASAPTDRSVSEPVRAAAGARSELRAAPLPLRS